MARPAIYSRKLSENLTLSYCHRSGEKPQGFWLYDKACGGNLAMGAPSSEDALVQAITYYQKRLATVEQAHKALQEKVDKFVDQFIKEEDD